MSNPTDRSYSETHEWVMLGQDGLLWIGITEFAQRYLGEIVFVGDFKLGANLSAGDVAGVVESVKAASDLYAPVDGVVATVNETLEAEPDLLNRAPFDTWIFKLRSTATLAGLLDAKGYERFARPEA
jgi:glycine cleavage system H protein